VADRLGRYLNADGDDIVFVDNATTGLNAVLRSLVLMPGDEVLATSLGYGAVRRTLEFVAERAGARIVTVDVPFPCRNADSVVASVAAGLSARTRLAIFDHVTSDTAVLFPLDEIIQLAAQRHVPVLIDGAHGPGQVPVDLRRLEALGACWYVANGHKWLGATKGCGFIWTRGERQRLLRPTTITEKMDGGYIAAFDWPGMKDFSPYLSLPAALDFRAELGEQAIQDYCHGLAVEAGETVAAAWGTETGSPETMTAFMTTVRFPDSLPADRATSERLRRAFRYDHGLEVVINPLEGALWARLSAYVYNAPADFQRVADIGLDLARS